MGIEKSVVLAPSKTNYLRWENAEVVEVSPKRDGSWVRFYLKDIVDDAGGSTTFAVWDGFDPIPRVGDIVNVEAKRGNYWYFCHRVEIVTPKPLEKPAPPATENKTPRARRVSVTQVASWQEVNQELGHRQEEVFYLIDRSSTGLSSQEIADILGLPLHSVSGRCTELEDMGRIMDSGQRRYNAKTNRYVTVWMVRPVWQRALAEFV